jgi:DNA repair protein RadA/Sms
MAKEKTVYLCTECGASFPKWAGQCGACKVWNTLEEQKPLPKNSGGISRSSGHILDFSAEQNAPVRNRISAGLEETNRVLGGGFFPDSLTLLVGNPGIGKSTLALQIGLSIAKENPDELVFIFSGEESAFQVCGRGDRLGGVPDNVKVASAYNISDVSATAEKFRPAFIVVDSVQTFTVADIPSGPGSIPQIRAVTEILMHTAKKQNIPVLLIGQVNKGGEMAGPQTLAHLVDTVLSFEGDDGHELRVLRSTKNRFGSTAEVGIFEMKENGLHEVKNPSAAFLSGRLPGAIGSVIFPSVEGNRPCLVEIQALTATSPFGLPKRSSSGIPLQRLSLLLAVLEKHANVKLASLDVFANVIGGLKIEETAADLAVCLAAASSRHKKPVPEKMLVIGEIGLSGEVRAVSHLEKRLKEGEKMGFTHAIVPAAQKLPTTKMQLLPIKTIGEALRVIS